MRIAILFHFTNEAGPSAVTVAQGEMTDLMLPVKGDTVSHTDFEGTCFRGCVLGRHFDYNIAQGADGGEVDGTITVTLSLGAINIH